MHLIDLINNIMVKYKVKPYFNDTYVVVKISTVFGERTSAYDIEPNKTEETEVFNGSLADCAAYIKLHEDGNM